MSNIQSRKKSRCRTMKKRAQSGGWTYGRKYNSSSSFKTNKNRKKQRFNTV